LILPGLPGGKERTLGVVARNFSGNLYTPRIIEEYHRAVVKKRMSAFLRSNQIESPRLHQAYHRPSVRVRPSQGLADLAFSTFMTPSKKSGHGAS
jgi:hypothetical protein